MFLESMSIPIAHNRFTYPTGISVHECLSAVGLVFISEYQRPSAVQKTALRAVGPLCPPALSPPAKALVEKGGQAGGGVRH